MTYNLSPVSLSAAPPKSIQAPKKKVERSAPSKPRAPTAVAHHPVADDNVPMGSSLDMPLIQNTMLGARDATVRLSPLQYMTELL